jgi:hypothetical protein
VAGGVGALGAPGKGNPVIIWLPNLTPFFQF